MIRANVVLPTPGGPQKIIDETRSFSMISRNSFPLPSKCVCPTKSSSVSGRTRVANGSLFSLDFSKIDPCLIQSPPKNERLFYFNTFELFLQNCLLTLNDKKPYKSYNRLYGHVLINLNQKPKRINTNTSAL